MLLKILPIFNFAIFLIVKDEGGGGGCKNGNQKNINLRKQMKSFIFYI